MATKIYRLTQCKNTASFTLTGKSGNVVGYQFKGGNAIKRVPAECVLHNEYYQRLLEDSDLYKRGVVKLARTINDEPVKEEQPKYKNIEDVTTAERAIEYVANEFGTRCRTGATARKTANAHGVDFPNLV